MNAFINICCRRNRVYGPIPGPPPGDQGQPLEGMRPMPWNQPYQDGPLPAANQFNQPPYQPPLMNQQAGGFQVRVIWFRVYLYVSMVLLKDSTCDRLKLVVCESTEQHVLVCVNSSIQY